ncbi:probable ATP-dependent RNA helicase DHR1 [[Candida] jaroonii]|uniref:Probable ATP-dependent RNA helicase DHR1 n=1 Tax=[Candida] jaroonii TaxID=467808 RepID=A0ACA9Y137_9ASCO|nr:probable ATP-dependent RNA helicase DHR1 [[Candida] jaroonii]
MGKYRKRFNEKARSGMLAKQAALKKARNKAYFRQLDDGTEPEEPQQVAIETDPNAEILKPLTEAEKAERKRKLQEELYSMNEKESKLSRSKRKRLDKYIEHQLKREEKKALFEKLSKTKIDTGLLASSKNLGKGKQTRKEEILEALELENQGRGDDRTKEILYEEREVKDWDEDNAIVFHEDEPEQPEQSEQASKFPSSEDDSDDSGDSESDFETPSSGFVDNRPAKFGGSGSGFGFSNIKTVEKKPSVKKYSWRSKIENDEAKKRKQEDELDFESSDDEDEDDEDDDEENEDQDDDQDDDQDENEVEGSDNEGSEEDEEDEEGSEEDSEEESEESEEDSDDDLPKLLSMKPKHSSTAEAFKEWADQQVREIEGRTEMVLPELSEELKQQYSKRHDRDEDMDHSSDDENYIKINKDSQRKAFFVEVNRPDEIQKSRIELPVFSQEHLIMEAVYHHDCIIVCGETGSGKTTQVPQFLYEAGFGSLDSPEYPGMIGVTQPRRVAAVSMAQRVKNELGDHGYRVGHQIRFDSTIKNEGTKDGTALKFMTDGVLLREMMSDFLLTKYSSIIIDEAHERNVNTDILIGMLSRVLKLRRSKYQKDPQNYKPLKLIIMSATLRVSDFAENKTLFKSPPPIVKVSARQYPVSTHFSRHTNYDYQEEAFKKVCKIHQRLPPGGILIFLTGQNEITNMVKRLKAEFPFPKKQSRFNKEEEDVKVLIDSKNADVEAEDIDLGIKQRLDGEEDDYDSESDEEGFEETLEDHQTPNDPLHVLPLYSLLPTEKQMKVFEEPPKGSRMCIVATNVAETSLTIPGIRYVVDCGRSKERKYNKETAIQSFEIDWISKASADQRAGRAGRTGAGHCYRLFSSAIYEDHFNQFTDPEIMRMPVESTVLSMKSMGIDQVVNFPFPTPPDRLALSTAEKILSVLGALNKDKAITTLGKAMSHFPLSPRFAKILIIGNQGGCLPYIIALVSALTVGDPFISEQEVIQGEAFESNDDENKKATITNFRKSRSLFGKLSNTSDALCLLSVVCAFDHVPKDKQDEFLNNNFLRPRIMKEISMLRQQITYIVKINTKSESIASVLQDSQLKLGVPNKKQVQSLKQIIASGFIDQIAIRTDLVSSDVNTPKNPNIVSIPYTTLTATTQIDDQTDNHVYIHPSSTLSTIGELPPDMLVYQLLNMSSNRTEGVLTKTRMKPLVDISGKQLANISKGSPLLTYSKPLGNKYAPKNLSPTKRECYVIPRFGAAIGSGGVGWDLPVIKVIQNKINGQWVTE